MKKAILEFLKSDRSYQGGVAVYMIYGTRQSLRKQLNLQSYTLEMEQILFEELRCLAEISTNDFNMIMSTAVQKEPLTVVMEEPVDPLEIPVTEIQSEVPEIPQEEEMIPPIVETEPEPVEILAEIPMEEPMVEQKEESKAETRWKFIKPKRR